MKYKIRPDAPMQWCEALNTVTMEVLKEQGRALSDLTWVDAEQQLTPGILAVALRHGEEAEDGIYVDMADVQNLKDVDSVLDATEQLQAIDRENPGMNSAAARAQLEEVSAETIKTVQGRVNHLLSAEVRPELKKHWQQLGGTL